VAETPAPETEWSLTALDQTRYRNDARRLLAQWLAHWLEEDHDKLFAEWQGVNVYGRFPGLKPGEPLTKPLLVLGNGSEESVNTYLLDDEGDPCHGTYVSLTFEVVALWDTEKTGQTVCDDLAGAVTQIAQEHDDDLLEAGALLLGYTAGDTSFDEQLDAWSNSGTLRLDIPIIGRKVN
jgi:hypothetical protein